MTREFQFLALFTAAELGGLVSFRLWGGVACACVFLPLLLLALSRN